MNEFPSKSLSDNRKSAIQNPKWLALSMIACVLMVTGAVAHAQQPGKISWIGYLAGSGSGPSPTFIQGLRDLGYTEGKNIGFVRLQVDVLVTDVTTRPLLSRKPPTRFLS